MAVYVDDMHQYPIGRKWGMRFSHMIADTEAELHEMAAKLGLQRAWYQGDHYDVSLAVRGRAVKLGAVEITYRDCGLMTVRRRHEGPQAPLCTPEEGRSILMEEMARRKLGKEAPPE